MEAFRKAHAGEAKARGFKLTPVAFLLKAAAAGPMAASPAPREGWSGWSIRSTVTRGISENLSTG